jgi:hypothetical protein
MFSGGDEEGYSNPIVRGKNTLSSAFVESCYQYLSTAREKGFTRDTREKLHRSCRIVISELERISLLAQRWEVLEVLTREWKGLMREMMENISQLLLTILDPKRKGGVAVMREVAVFTDVNKQTLDEEQNFERELERSRMILRENRKTKEQKELLRVMKKLQLGEWKTMRDKAKELDEDYYTKTTEMVKLQKIQQPGFRGKKVFDEMSMNMELLDDEEYSRAMQEVSEDVLQVEDVDYDA